MKKIDFHIIIHPFEDRSENLNHLLDKFSKERLFNVHLIDGIEGDIGSGRKIGFTKGECEYVSYVDDDDDFIPGAASKCADILDNDHSLDAVATLEYVSYKGDVALNKSPLRFLKGGLLTPRGGNCIHHLVVFRRSSLNKYLEELGRYKGLPEHGLIAKMLLDGRKFKLLEEPGYIWRRKDGTGHAIPATSETKEIIKKAMSFKN